MLIAFKVCGAKWHGNSGGFGREFTTQCECSKWGVKKMLLIINIGKTKTMTLLRREMISFSRRILTI